MRLNVSLLAVSAAVTFTTSGAQAVGGDRARIASTTHLEAHLFNITPADEVGADVVMKLEGKITTPHRQPASSCRGGRQAHAYWVLQDGKTEGIDLFLSDRAGHLGLDGMLLVYGDEINPAGGKFKVRITVDKSRVAADTRGHLYTCKKLKETVEMDYPPQTHAD